MTAREKVIFAEQQILHLGKLITCPDCMGAACVLQGNGCGTCENSGKLVLSWIDCPFCGCRNTPEQTLLCCGELAELSDAIMAHLERKQMMEVMERVAERFEKMQSRAIIAGMN